MPERKIPDKYLSAALPENIAWLDKYRVAPPGLRDSIYQRIELLLKYVQSNQKPFNTFKQRDIRDFIEQYKQSGAAPSTLNNTISYLVGFRNYLIENHSKEFPKDFLEDISKLRVQGASRKNGTALNLVQLSAVRHFISDKPKYRYTFEMFLQTDVKKQDIEICHLEYADEGNMCFRSADGKICVSYTRAIQTMLEDCSKKQENIKVTSNVVLPYLSEITKNLREKNLYFGDKDLKIYDIRATRDKFFIICPNCKERLESSASNWVLAKADIDDEFHLVCKYCKGEPLSDENTD